MVVSTLSVTKIYGFFVGWDLVTLLEMTAFSTEDSSDWLDCDLSSSEDSKEEGDCGGCSSTGG